MSRCMCWAITDVMPEFTAAHPEPKCGTCRGYVQPAGLPTRAEVLTELRENRWRIQVPKLGFVRARWAR